MLGGSCVLFRSTSGKSVYKYGKLKIARASAAVQSRYTPKGS